MSFNYEQNGIKRQLTAPHTLQHKDVIERKNRMVVGIARCMLKKGSVPMDMWGEAIPMAVYLLNHSSTSVVEDCTPHEALTGFSPIVKHLRVFCCVGFTRLNFQQ